MQPPRPSGINLTADFFGGIKLRRGRRLLTGFATQKVIGLFCRLLDSGEEPISREQLMAMFWGESPEDQARYNLRYALWNIRKVFKESEDDPDPLLSNRTICSLNPDISYSIDCRTFEENLAAINSATLADLSNTLDLYKGPFLHGFALRNLDEWEDWLSKRRDSLHQKFISASISAGNLAISTGQPESALDLFQRVITTSPDLDQAHEGLIRAYAFAGRTSAAIRQYNTYVQVMKREFNAPPSQAITQFLEDLRSGTLQSEPRSEPAATSSMVTIPVEPVVEPEQEPIPEATEPIIEETLPPQEEFIPVVPFIGRTQELKDVQGMINDVVGGQGLVLIVSGEMGIGKTRLFNEIRRMLPSEFVVGVGESREIESTRPLEDIMQVLEAIGRDPRLLPGEIAELKTLFALQQKVIEQEEDASEAMLLEGIRRWTVTLASNRPVLIALDDMHWAGEPLRKIFSALAQEVRRLPLLLVGIFRTFEEQSEDTIASALISIARTGRLRRIELGSLSFENTVEILNKRAPEAAEALSREELDRVYQYSSGIPLYVVELAGTLLEGQTDFIRSPALIDQPDFTPSSERKLVPRLMVNITNFRLSQLTSGSVRMLKIAALILGEIGLDLTHRFTGLDQDAVEEMLVELEDRNFLHNFERGGRLLFAFNHQMIKIAIADTIPTLERQRLFREIVKVLEAAGETVSTDALAYYLYNTGDKAAALEPLLTSANFWFSYGDRSAGLRFAKVAYQIALERLETEPDRMLEVILKHCDFLLKIGLVKSAIDVLTAALEKLATRPDDRSNLLHRRAELAQLLSIDAKPTQVVNQPLALFTAKRALAEVKLVQGDLTGAEKLLSEVEESLGDLPDTPEGLRLTGLHFLVKAKLLLEKQESVKAIPLLESAAELLRQSGTPTELAVTYLLTGRSYRFAGEYDKAADALQNCYLMVQGGQPSSELVDYHHENGLLMYADEHYLEAEEAFANALDAARAHGVITTQLPQLLMDYARILTERGDKEKARLISRQAEETARHLNQWGDLLGVPEND